MSYGPHVYFLGGATFEDADRVVFADLSTGSKTVIPIRLLDGERISSLATDGDHLAVLAWRRPGGPGEEGTPCSSRADKPIAWRVLASALRADGAPMGTFHEVDRRTSRLVFVPAGAGMYCAGPVEPELAAADGRLAYAVEDPSPTRPSGSTILVRDFDAGRIVRSVATTSQVVWIALSGTTLAWAESGNGARLADPSWAMRRASLPRGAPSTVRLGPTRWAGPGGPIALDGAALYSVPNLPLDGPYVSVALRTVGGITRNIAEPLEPWSCGLLAAGGGIAAMHCSPPGSMGQASLVLWSSTSGYRTVAGADPVLASVGGGWVAWIEEDGAASELRGFELGPSLR